MRRPASSRSVPCVVLPRRSRSSIPWYRASQMTTSPDPENPWLRMSRASGDEYDEPYERRAAAGENVHGEADFVMRFSPATVLDGGCGTGRVARELVRRCIDVVGVDLDD